MKYRNRDGDVRLSSHRPDSHLITWLLASSFYYSDHHGDGYGKHYGANDGHYGSNKHGQYGNHYNKKSFVHHEVSSILTPIFMNNDI